MEALNDHETREQTCAAEMEEKRKLKASHSKQVMVLERKIAKHKADADKRNPTAVKTKEETLRAKKKLELATKQLEKHAAEAEQCAQDIRRLESDLANVNAAEAAFEREFADDISGGGGGGGGKGGGKSKSKKQKTGGGAGSSAGGAAAHAGASGLMELGAAQMEVGSSTHLHPFRLFALSHR